MVFLAMGIKSNNTFFPLRVDYKDLPCFHGYIHNDFSKSWDLIKKNIDIRDNNCFVHSSLVHDLVITYTDHSRSNRWDNSSIFLPINHLKVNAHKKPNKNDSYTSDCPFSRQIEGSGR